MKTYEALQKAIAGRTADHARRLSLSTIMVNKWQEPHTDWSDSGAYNPLDRIEAIIETAISQGNKDALAPLQYLAEKFGIVMIPMPKQKGCLSELQHELMQSVKEFGDLAQAAGLSLADGKISRKEAELIQREAWDLIRQVAVFDRKAQEASK